MEEAKTIFEGLVAIDPRNAYYYRALGSIYWREKNSQKALKQLAYAIRTSPNDLSNYINRAEILVSNKQFEDARSDLKFILNNANKGDEPILKKAKAILQMI